MYMAQIHEVTSDSVDNSGPIFDDEPMHKVQTNNDNYNVFAMENEHPKEHESSSDMYLTEQERDLLARLHYSKLKCEIDDKQNLKYFESTSNKRNNWERSSSGNEQIANQFLAMRSGSRNDTSKGLLCRKGLNHNLSTAASTFWKRTCKLLFGSPTCLYTRDMNREMNLLTGSQWHKICILYSPDRPTQLPISHLLNATNNLVLKHGYGTSSMSI
ncbi:hypothetical protein Tco_0717365 [Tanacetum coccineum]